MIHGMWGGSWCWDNYKTFFEKRGYHCVTTTLRHHDINPTAHPDSMLGTTSLLDYVNDLEQKILQLNMKPIVMGHSMGGLLAQILGSRDLAKALVLLTPAPPSGIMSLSPGTIKSFWNVLAKWEFWKTANRQIFDGAVYSMLHLMLEEHLLLMPRKSNVLCWLFLVQKTESPLQVLLKRLQKNMNPYLHTSHSIITHTGLLENRDGRKLQIISLHG